MEIRALDDDPTVREAEVLNKDRLPGARWGLALALASLFWLARRYRLCICRAVHSRCAVRARRVQGYRSHLTFTHRQDRAIGFLSGEQQSVRGPARVSCGKPSVATAR